MTWSWNHTQEGMQNVENNIRILSNKILAEVYAEWAASTCVHGNYTFNEKVYDIALLTGTDMVHNARPELLDFIIDKTFALAECTSGGFEAHICPYGCHTVSFDSDEPIDEQDDPDHNFR